MAGFFRLILAFLAATVIAFGVPRDAGREVALHVRWERHLGDAVPGISGDSSASDRTVVVSSSDRFALLDGADGAVRAGGIRTDVFTASSAGFINQSSSVPRWAVQSWAGDILSIVPNRGDPHLRDTILAQFSGDGTVWVEDIETGNEYLVDLPPDSTVYDLTLRSGGEPWIAAGSLRGELLVAGPDDEEPNATTEGNAQSSNQTPGGVTVDDDDFFASLALASGTSEESDLSRALGALTAAIDVEIPPTSSSKHLWRFEEGQGGPFEEREGPERIIDDFAGSSPCANQTSLCRLPR